MLVIETLNLAEAEKAIIIAALEKAAADALGITRHALKRRLTKHGLGRPART